MMAPMVGDALWNVFRASGFNGSAFPFLTAAFLQAVVPFDAKLLQQPD
jgi:hypothetical protein